jgi:hypothetical protein
MPLMTCSHCASAIPGASRFCNVCGQPAAVAARPSGSGNMTGYGGGGPVAASRGLGQIFGLDPRIAILTFIVDIMLNAGEIASMGLLVPFSIFAAAILAFVAFKAQVNWYGDDTESAVIKALILGLLTAIPTALPAFLYMPSGFLGLIHLFTKKK